jgi:hypothetical protein
VDVNRPPFTAEDRQLMQTLRQTVWEDVHNRVNNPERWQHRPSIQAGIQRAAPALYHAWIDESTAAATED